MKIKELRFVKTIPLVGIVSAIIILLFSGSSMALDASDVQVILKSKNLGPNPSFGGNDANILITLNKMGKLVYIEEYYGTDFEGEPKFYSGNRKETVMQDYTVSFDLIRPGSKHDQYWSMIKSTIILDNVIIYDIWINTTGTYKSSPGRQTWFNNSTIDIGKGKPIIQKKEPFRPTVPVEILNNTSNDTVNNGTDAKESTMLEISTVIVTIFSVYMFRKSYMKKEKKN